MRVGIKSLLAGAVIGLTTLSASAEIIITSTRTAGSGASNGLDIVRFFAAFSPTSPEGTAGAGGLQSVNVTLESSGNMKFKTSDFDFDGELDIDTTAATISDAVARTNNTTNTGTFIRVPVTSSFVVVGSSPSGSRSDTDGDMSPDTEPTQTFAAVKSFRIEGFQSSGFDAQAKTANAGQVGAGALFAVAVVPTGSTVRAFGGVAGDKGATTFFDTVPEPTSLALVGGLAMGLLGRRRRNA